MAYQYSRDRHEMSDVRVGVVKEGIGHTVDKRHFFPGL